MIKIQGIIIPYNDYQYHLTVNIYGNIIYPFITYIFCRLISHSYIYTLCFFINQTMDEAENIFRDFNDMRKMTDIVQVPL